MDKYYSYSGECLHTRTEETIDIRYVGVPAIGQHRTGYRRMNPVCEYSDDCPDTMRCPIFLAAPITK